MQNANQFAAIWALGYPRLCPIIPPDAELSERSSLYKRLHAKNPRDDRGKVPGVRGRDGAWFGFDFVQHESTEADLQRWHEMGAGVGIKTGAGLALIDADAPNEAHARIIRDTLEQHLGFLPPVRIGNYPKAGYLVRTDDDFQYTRIDFGERDDKGRLRDRVEILSEGRQFVAHGIHPKTGKPYRWPGGIPAYKDVPFVEGAKLTAFLDALRPLLPAASEVLTEGAASDVDPMTLVGDPDLIRKAVSLTPNTSDAFPTRDAWRDYVYAIKGAFGPGREAEALEVAQDWSARWTDGDNDPDYVAAEFARMKPTRRGANWLYEIAEQHSNGQFTRAEQWFEPVPEDREPLFAAQEKADAADRPKTFNLNATPYDFKPPTDIEPRQWLYGGHYIRKFVSATVAPSGVGKSSLGIVEALAMASGKALLGVEPKGQFRVWLWNGEDPRDELNRRIAAAMLHYGLTREDIGDRLFVDTGRETEIILATTVREGVKISEPVTQALTKTLSENRIDVLVVDPFVSSHRVSENDNGAIDAVTKQWARLADQCNCSVELVHHVRKLNGAEITVEDSRGAVALLATSRSARAISRMTKPEAMRFGLEEKRARLFRFGDGKNNLALPAGDDTRWFELVSVPLGNGTGSGFERFETGDSVGVVAVYEGASGAVVVNEDGAAGARDLIDAGEWRRDVRAGDAWIGVPIAQALGLDIEDPADKGHVRSVISQWIRSGRLREVSRKDEKRRPRTYVEWNETAEIADNLSKINGVSAFD